MTYKEFFELIKSNSTQLSSIGQVPANEINECVETLENLFQNHFRELLIEFLKSPATFHPSEYGFDSWNELICNKFSNAAEYFNVYFTEDECRKIHNSSHSLENLSLMDNVNYFMCSFGSRVINSLNKAGIHTFRPLLSMTHDEIKMIIGVGEKSADEIIAVLEDNKERFGLLK